MSQVPIDLSPPPPPPPREIGGEIAQLIPFFFSNKRSKKIRATCHIFENPPLPRENHRSAHGFNRTSYHPNF